MHHKVHLALREVLHRLSLDVFIGATLLQLDLIFQTLRAEWDETKVVFTIKLVFKELFRIFHCLVPEEHRVVLAIDDEDD